MHIKNDIIVFKVSIRYTGNLRNMFKYRKLKRQETLSVTETIIVIVKYVF